jgi:RNA polymerase sigma-70 factor (ECF subfamily)
MVSVEYVHMESRPAENPRASDESERLARAFIEGDRSAFDRLVIMHQDLVFRVCLRFLGDYDEAEDCAQEVFIKVSRYLPGFRFESGFATWLYRVAVNTCKNILSSRDYRMKRQRVRLYGSGRAEAGEDLDENVAAALPDDSPSPADEAAGREIYGIIREAIDSLPVQQKLVVVLRDMEGRSYEEIAGITGLRMGTVKSQLSRARERIREAVKGKI